MNEIMNHNIFYYDRFGPGEREEGILINPSDLWR